MDKSRIEELNKEFSKATPQEVLTFFVNEFKGEIAFASSLGAEDQVLTDMLAGIDKSVKIFTLDTGRLFPETYDLIDASNKHYGIAIETYFPNFDLVQQMVSEKGINLFYDSVEDRKLCCNTRKMEPLKRAFKGMKAWISGLRAEQSITRYNTPLIEWDEGNKLVKINPLIDWLEEDVWDYIKKNKVPYNKLHDMGFPSIGCQPCTRAIEEGEDIRAGRWWWETPDKKECGLHIKE